MSVSPLRVAAERTSSRVPTAARGAVGWTRIVLDPPFPPPLPAGRKPRDPSPESNGSHHVSKHTGDALDRVRREEHRELLAAGDPVLTGTRHLWLEHHEFMVDWRRGVLDVLKSFSLRTARAWAMKHYATTLWSYLRPAWAEQAWNRLISWMRRSRLEPMKRVALTIRAHLWGIVNAIVRGVTNAGSESVDARIQRVKRMACGFRNKQRFRNAILFHLGGLDLYPAAGSSTHTDS
ncbi:MAG: transposase [Planctomycetes bacterium]|nr:transposase [Planctomycetota bacterium]